MPVGFAVLRAAVSGRKLRLRESTFARFAIRRLRPLAWFFFLPLLGAAVLGGTARPAKEASLACWLQAEGGDYDWSAKSYYVCESKTWIKHNVNSVTIWNMLFYMPSFLKNYSATTVLLRKKSWPRAWDTATRLSPNIAYFSQNCDAHGCPRFNKNKNTDVTRMPVFLKISRGRLMRHLRIIKQVKIPGCITDAKIKLNTLQKKTIKG